MFYKILQTSPVSMRMENRTVDYKNREVKNEKYVLSY